MLRGMTPKRAWLGLCLLAALTGCTKTPAEKPAASPPPPPPAKETVTLVDPAERSRHFAAVNRHLELGGVLYGYVDIDGDLEHFATLLRGYADGLAANEPRAAILKQDFVRLFADLGLTDIKAAGFSSVAGTDGLFRNRCFFLAPDGHHGLLAALGGPSSSFKYTRLAPADADVYGETELDLPAAYAAIRTVVTRVSGEATANRMDAALQAAGAEQGVSALALVQHWKGRCATVVRLDGDRTLALPLPKPVTIPAFSLLACFAGIGPSVQGLLEHTPAFTKSVDGTRTLYTFKAPLADTGWQPLLVVDGDALYFATSRAFLDACLAPGDRLAQTPAFQHALARVGTEGNGLSYVSPRFFQRFRALPVMNAGGDPSLQQILQLAVAQLPDINEPSGPSPPWPYRPSRRCVTIRSSRR